MTSPTAVVFTFFLILHVTGAHNETVSQISPESDPYNVGYESSKKSNFLERQQYQLLQHKLAQFNTTLAEETTAQLLRSAGVETGTQEEAPDSANSSADNITDSNPVSFSPSPPNHEVEITIHEELTTSEPDDDIQIIFNKKQAPKSLAVPYPHILALLLQQTTPACSVPETSESYSRSRKRKMAHPKKIRYCETSVQQDMVLTSGNVKSFQPPILPGLIQQTVPDGSVSETSESSRSRSRNRKMAQPRRIEKCGTPVNVEISSADEPRVESTIPPVVPSISKIRKAAASNSGFFELKNIFRGKSNPYIRPIYPKFASTRPPTFKEFLSSIMEMEVDEAPTISDSTWTTDDMAHAFYATYYERCTKKRMSEQYGIPYVTLLLWHSKGIEWAKGRLAARYRLEARLCLPASDRESSI